MSDLVAARWEQEKLLEKRWENMHLIDESMLRFKSAQKTLDTAAEQCAEARKEAAQNVAEGERLAALYDSIEVWITARNDDQEKPRSTTGTGGDAVAYHLPCAASPESSEASGFKRQLFDGLPQRPAEKRLKTESGLPILTSSEEAAEEVDEEVAQVVDKEEVWEEVDEEVAQEIFSLLDKEAAEEAAQVELWKKVAEEAAQEAEKVEFWKKVAEKVDEEVEGDRQGGLLSL
jgi:hypothetical protein